MIWRDDALVDEKVFTQVRGGRTVLRSAGAEMTVLNLRPEKLQFSVHQGGVLEERGDGETDGGGGGGCWHVCHPESVTLLLLPCS